MDFPLSSNIGKWEKCGEHCGDTHIYEAAAVAAKELSVCRYLLPSTFCLCFSVSACTYLYQYILYVSPAYRRVCDFYESLCLLAVLLVWASYVARIPL